MAMLPTPDRANPTRQQAVDDADVLAYKLLRVVFDCHEAELVYLEKKDDETAGALASLGASILKAARCLAYDKRIAGSPDKADSKSRRS